MDIWISPYRANAEKLVNVLREFGFDLPELSPELFLTRERIIRMGVPPFRIELFTSISGVDFDECYAGRISDVIDEVDVNIIGLKHLKINKRASGRPKDIDDLETLH